MRRTAFLCLLLAAFWLLPTVVCAQVNHVLSDSTAWQAAPDLKGSLNIAQTRTATQKRPLIDKGGRVFEARAYGAVCDDSTDDAAAFIAANTAAAAAGGGTVTAPRSTTPCVIGSTIALSANVNLRGAGMGVSVLKRKSTFNASSLIVTGNNSTVSDITIDGNYPARTGGAGPEISLGGNHSTIERVEIKNPYYIGIGFGGVADGKVLNSVLTGANAQTTEASYGIWAADPGIIRPVVAFNRITNWTVAGIYAGATDMLIKGNHLAGNHTQTAPTGGGQIANGAAGRVIVMENYIGPGGGSFTSGLEVDNGAWTISGNTIVGQQYYGIILQGGSGHTLTNNKSTGSGTADFNSAIAATAWRGWQNSPAAANNVTSPTSRSVPKDGNVMALISLPLPRTRHF